mgnify:FL=1
MIQIYDSQIAELDISPRKCVEWVTEAFKMKKECQLPAKVSVHPNQNDFITTMPCLLPTGYHTFGVKVVSRVNGRHPALRSNLMLFDSRDSELKAILDANWITSMRTGAVATLAIKTFRRNNTHVYSIIGLGETAHATMKCLLSELSNEHLCVRVFRYKDQAERFIKDFSSFSNVSFSIVDTIEELVAETDVLISCITDAQDLLVKDTSLFKPGILLVPVHTRGFQNCDTFFDKVFADDTAHVQGFKFFNQFKKFGEIGDVLTCNIQGRESNDERILSYNIGLGLHDVLFATRILEILKR